MGHLLIKNGSIITEKGLLIRDILVKDKLIVSIDSNIQKPNSTTEVIDANSMYILPGAIDAHVHLDLPTPAGKSSDDFKTGSIAAIAGGTTSIIDFVTPAKEESLLKALKERKEVASQSLIDYGFHMGVCGWNKNSASEIEQCIKKEGITSFKVYLAYKGSVGIEDTELIKIMQTVAKFEALVTVHCEHGDVIKALQSEFISNKQSSPIYHALSHPASIETEAVYRVLAIAKIFGCKVYIVHVSAKESKVLIRKAQLAKQKVYAETCPQYLLLDDKKYNLPGFQSAAYVISPPLRKKADQMALWDGLKKGTFQVVATDHCPFNMKGQKDAGIHDFTKIPNGAGGIEHRMSLLYTYGVLKNKITLNQWVQLCCTQPAKIFGLFPQKGTISIGSDADILIWNPHKISKISKKKHFQQCDSDIYDDIKIKGSPEYVIVNGILAFDKGNIVNQSKLKGNYLNRK